jgi:hypothetical protein
MERKLTKSEIDNLAGDLTELLLGIVAGEVTSTSTMKHRIEGAITALRVANGQLSKAQFDLMEGPRFLSH